MEDVEVDWNQEEVAEGTEEVVFEQEEDTLAMSKPNPRIGGGTDTDTWWTGGPNLKKLTRPKSSNARRPTDLKSLAKVQDACEEGLSESRQLGTSDDKDNNITVTSWVNEIRGLLEKRGMDTVFSIIQHHPKQPYEINLLTEWGEVSMIDVKNWVEQLKTTGVIQPDGTEAPICAFDSDNLDWSATMLKNSITVRLWEEIESDLEYGATGPEIFIAIMGRFQHASASAVRALVKKLEKLKLVQEPGMNVDTFSTKLADVVQQILAFGPKSVPEDLSSLVAQCFLDTDVDEFKLEASSIFNKVDRDPRSMQWRAIITDLKTKYRSLEGIGRWPHKNKKDVLTEEIALLNGTVNSLTQKLEDLRGSQGQKRTCFNCGADGHLRKDCPKPPQGNQSQQHPSGGAGTKHWTKVKPTDGQPHKKMVDKDEYLWCEKCGRWRKGDNKHLTADHRTRAQIEADGNTAPAAPQIGGAHIAVNPSGRLQMMQGLFTGSVCLPVEEHLN